jgi:hypothetical protein
VLLKYYKLETFSANQLQDNGKIRWKTFGRKVKVMNIISNEILVE